MSELFGIGPDEILEGDLVCLIYGLSVPVILRHVEEKPYLGFKEPPLLHRYKRHPSMTPQAKFLDSFSPHPGSRRPSRSPLQRSSPAFTTSKSDSGVPTSHKPLFPASLYYKVIGEAYVNGMMEGQALHKSRYAATEQYFTLV